METKKIIALVLILGLLALGTFAIATPTVSARPLPSGTSKPSCHLYETTGPFDPAGIYDENHSRCWHYA